jgi:nucleoside-diphosphate-sugar epimerase
MPPETRHDSSRGPAPESIRPHHFITGATGFIGRRLAVALRSRGEAVTALVRKPYAARDLADAGVRIVRGDITDAGSVRRGMAGCDSVFHVAGMYVMNPGDPILMERVNVEGTRHVLEAMRDLNVRKGVYTSSLAVNSDTDSRLVDESYRYEGKHLSCYDRTKWQAHYDVAVPMIELGLPLVIVQPGVVYGPGDHSAIARMFEFFLRGRLPAVPGGSRFCWAHVDDIVDGHIAALDRGDDGESYFLAGPVHTFMDIFRAAAEITRRRPPLVEIPPALMKAALPFAALAERFSDPPEPFTTEAIRSSAGVTYIGSNQKAKRHLGFDPRPIEIGLRDTLTDIAERISRTLSRQDSRRK